MNDLSFPHILLSSKREKKLYLQGKYSTSTVIYKKTLTHTLLTNVVKRSLGIQWSNGIYKYKDIHKSRGIHKCKDIV